MTHIYMLLIFVGTAGAILSYMCWYLYRAENFHHEESKQHR
ncbi:MAG: hypothetical protein ACR2PU_02845 [Gammaproteobacteria bacterium]